MMDVDVQDNLFLTNFGYKFVFCGQQIIILDVFFLKKMPRSSFLTRAWSESKSFIFLFFSILKQNVTCFEKEKENKSISLYNL